MSLPFVCLIFLPDTLNKDKWERLKNRHKSKEYFS